MRHLSLLSAFFLTFLVGCDAVTVDKPFGDLTSKELRDSLRGSWAAAEGDVFHIETTENEKLMLGMMRWNAEHEKFEIRNTPMTLRLVGKRPLLFLPAEENGSDRFIFLWLSHVDSTSINARMPDPKLFREAVENGQLDGKIIQTEGKKSFEVQLTPSDAVLERLAGPDGDKYFSEESDQPLRRLGKHNEK